MKNTHSNTGSTSAPQEQTGERDWSWDVRDNLPFRRLSTVYGCRTADADGFEELFVPGAAHEDFPLMLADDSRSTRIDKWTGITWFKVDFLGAANAAQEAALFKPFVKVEKIRYLTTGLIAQGGLGQSSGYIPKLTVTHLHREEVDDVAYAVYLDAPRPRPQSPFFERRLYVMFHRTKTQIGSYWQYRDIYTVPLGTGLGFEGSVTSPKTQLASFDGCTADDTFQDRLDRNAVILTDAVFASPA